jgi:small subunit ribosomal protein S18
MSKKCYFTENNIQHIDYKNVNVLGKFLNKYGRIAGRKRSGVTAKHQRNLALAVKRARFMALIPYINNA